MGHERHQRIKELLLAALDLEPDRRDAYLADACGEDNDLLGEVESLLVLDGGSIETFLNRPAVEDVDVAALMVELDVGSGGEGEVMNGAGASLERPGEPAAGGFGRYRVIEEIGEGGMGVVYLAEQLEPLQRRVALKVIKLGMDTARFVARFESERHALALMNHPNIARVFDAGATDEGRPFFVMEYVEGEPITRFCTNHRLTTRQRLELFCDVCLGVQHAHHKGIIHRDIKASNVLVECVDGRFVPKIIDFGLAKATAGYADGKTLFTEQGVIVGTPEYMSPEQAGMGSLDIDSRTDVFSLGVLLYRLLVGTLPASRSDVGGASPAEIHRRLRESAPVKPSSRLSSDRALTRTAADTMATDPGSLVRALRGDLDWIVMKALEKDRDRRYGTPSELAADIRRHLRHEPVAAGPPSLRYRVSKFSRRHRGLVVAVSALAATLILGVVGTSIGLVRATSATREAEEQRTLASLEAEKALALSDFLVETLSAPDPARAGRDVRVAEVLDRAAEDLDRWRALDPEVEAAVRTALGESYRGLGLFDAARRQFVAALEIRQEVLGPNRPETAEALANLALLQGDQGQAGAAEEGFELALENMRLSLGEIHPRTLSIANDLAVLLVSRGKLDEAESLYRSVLAAGDAHPGSDPAGVPITQGNLAYLLQLQGRLPEAEELYREALDRLRDLEGDRHPQVIDIMNNLGTLLNEMGRLEESADLLVESLELRREVLGPEHPWTLHSMNNVASVLQALGRLEEAEPLYREAVEGNRRLFGDDHPETLTSMNNLAYFLDDHGDNEDAEEIYRRVVDRRIDVLGRGHQDSLSSMHNLASLLLEVGRLEEAEGWSREATEGARLSLPEGHYLTAIFEGRLGVILLRQGKFDEARVRLEHSAEELSGSLGPDHPRTLQVEAVLDELDVSER
ncbi:MAG: serine/threonine-protein kinase [Thermoanaerobaculales bacterium]|nr:serine/threonine-protein kinase [Thermoanaerobaculales bacterium]